MSAVVKDGDLVAVHYTGTLEDDTVFDTSAEREPLEFTIGAGGLVKGFEEAVIGMAAGDKKSFTVTSEDAYGAHSTEHVVEIPKDQLPPELNPQVGTLLDAHREDGASTTVLVVSVSDDKVVVDGNHPLAGRDLTFNIELVEIKKSAEA